MARVLAPLALAAVVVAMLMIVSSGSEDSVKGSDSGVSASTPKNGGNGNGGGGGDPDGEAEPAASSVPKKYTIESGDTLTSIAANFAVETSQIVQLNPDLDPQALTTGETIKLR